MERYKIIKKLGEGTFGSVWKAIDKENGEVVAVKTMKRKYYSWEECLNLREVKSLRKMNHAKIVKLKEVTRELNILHFVFEYMDCNLYEIMKSRGKAFSEAEIRTCCLQVFQGLAYMHQQGYFHRDLKPENLLVSENVIKIADFGFARETNSPPPYTDYVSTRWYRAPEVMLKSLVYTSAVDMWAMGAIMAELFTLTPLFPGLSEADQMYKICNVMGTPTTSKWVEGLKLAGAINYQFPQCNGVPLSALIPSASDDAINLITRLCSWDPCKRPSALEVLQHPFFQSCYYIPPSLRYRTPVNRMPPPGFAPSTRVAKNQGNNINYNLLKAAAKAEPIYWTPARNIPYHDERTRGVLETSEMLANMTFRSVRVPTRQTSIPMPPVKTGGGWGEHVRSDPFIRRPQQIYPVTTYARKAAG